MSRQKTAMFVAAVGGHGGPVASLRDILPGLKGFRRVCVGPWSEVALESLRHDRADTIHKIVRPRGRYILQAAVQIRRLLKQEKPDVVFANGLSEASLLALAMTGAGAVGQVGVVVWIHNYELPTITMPLAGFIARKRFRWCAVSPLAAGLALDNGLADHVERIPNPIADDIIADRVAGSGRLRVAYLGTDKAYKGFDFLRPIMEATRDLPITWRLHLKHREGHPWWADLQPLLDDPGLDIQVVGRVSPVRRAYAEADVVIIPSRQESFCRVAAEAMANRIPVVATALSPLRTLLGNDEAGILVGLGDTDGFAAALRRLHGDLELRERFGREGERRATEFELSKVQNAWMEQLTATL